MARLLVIIALALGLASSARAGDLWAFHGSGGGAAAANCPMGTSDGCQNAPTDGAVKFPGLFSNSASGYQNGANTGIARLSGQTYAGTGRPAFDVAVVDFSVGPSASEVASFGGYRDPVAATNPGGDLANQGCSNDGGGTMGGPRIRCGGTAALHLLAYDWSGASSAGGWHCIPLIIENTYTTEVEGRDNKFVNGNNCVWNAVLGLGYSGVAYSGYIPQDELLCLGTQSQGAAHTPVAGDVIGAIDYANTTETPPTLSTPAGGTCPNGYTAFAIPHLVACPSTCSQGHPVTIGIENTTLVITTSQGTIQTGFFIQGADGAGSTQDPDVSTCAPGCGGPGSYTITMADPTYSPQEAYTLGLIQAPVTSWGNTAVKTVLWTKNSFDGQATGPAPLNINCAICVATGQSATISYNATFRCQCRPISAGFTYTPGQPLSFVETGNYTEEWGMNFADGHLEVTSDGFPNNSIVALQQITANTVNTTPDTVPSHGTTLLWLGPGVGDNVTIQNTIVAYNVGITNPAGTPIGGATNVVNTLIERQDATYLSVSVHDNAIDGSGMAWCVGYDGNTLGAGSVAVSLANNINLITGNVQTGYGGIPCN